MVRSLADRTFQLRSPPQQPSHVLRHDAAVLDVEFFDDGSRLATVGYDRFVPFFPQFL